MRVSSRQKRTPAVAAVVGMARRFLPHRNRLLLVVDDAGWILDEVGCSLAAHLPVALRSRVVSRDWATARHCTIHFVNRPWAWEDRVLDRVHRSNRLIGLWWHGRLDSPEPAVQAALARLRHVQHRFQRIQVTCSSGLNTLLAVGVSPSRIVQLPEGVDVQMFRPPASDSDRRRVRRNLGIPDDAFVIGCFQKDGEGWTDGSRPKLVKGPDVLADVLTRLKPRCPVYALLPGPSRGYVTTRLSKAEVPFVAPGFVSRSALAGFYHALDVYVSPSRDEGGPAGVLEAMASGVPVVSTLTGMPADLITSGEDGVLVPIDDAEALSEAVLRFAERPELRATIASRARSLIVQYDWSLVAARYANELYAS